jgi:NAD-dependent SIR2 family protein deacetylase
MFSPAPPQSDPDADTALETLAELVAPGGVVVLSGAGLSTESGIPDYRGPSGALRARTPMTYQSFTRDPLARRRYWARSHLGWRRIDRAVPNRGHAAVAQLQRHGLLDGIVTQNVDGLHQAAGGEQVIELHGSLDRVVCLDCGDRTGRANLERRLRAANPDFEAAVAAVNPDGDVDIDEAALGAFAPVECLPCGGVLKPDVVFFGETVPAERVRACFDLVDSARTMLVLGSSLTVMSGRRFVVRAAQLGRPVAIVNQGPTRADDRATVRLSRPLGELLPELARRLGAGPIPAGGLPIPLGRAS